MVGRFGFGFFEFGPVAGFVVGGFAVGGFVVGGFAVADFVGFVAGFGLGGGLGVGSGLGFGVGGGLDGGLGLEFLDALGHLGDDILGLLGIDARQLRQGLGGDLDDVGETDVSGGHEFIGHVGSDGLDAGQLLDGGLSLPVVLGGGEDIDVPTAQPCGQADVLSPLADGQAQLVLGHEDVRPVDIAVQEDLLDLGGLEGVGDKDLGRLVEPDDVDLLASDLFDDVLDAAAADADAGADGVDAAVGAGDGHLGAVPGFACESLDLDDAVGHLGHLEFEQADDQFRMDA